MVDARKDFGLRQIVAGSKCAGMVDHIDLPLWRDEQVLLVSIRILDQLVENFHNVELIDPEL